VSPDEEAFLASLVDRLAGAVPGLDAVAEPPDVVPENRLHHESLVRRRPLQLLGEALGVDVHALRVAHPVQARPAPEPVLLDLRRARRPEGCFGGVGLRHAFKRTARPGRHAGDARLPDAVAVTSP
jgi:hypothetical protein